MNRIISKIISLLLIFLAVSIFSISYAKADERDEEITSLKQQVQGLLKRIEALEQGQAKTKETVVKQQEAIDKKAEPSVVMDKLVSKLKLKGRWAAGYYYSGKSGSYHKGSFEIPDVKLIFTFEPDDINKLTLRMNLNNAEFKSVDYAYLETKLDKFFNLSFPLSSRVGRIRDDFGEEYKSNNPIEGALPSNSASNIDGKDEGVYFTGKIWKNNPVSYAVSVTNGTSGTGSDSSAPKAFTGKLFYNFIDPLYVSASYYNSGSMKSSNTEMSIAGLTSRPTNATNWTRQIWEVDMRYDYKKKDKKFVVPAYADSKAILQLSYGGFSDDVSVSPASTKRAGMFGMSEGLYNVTKKFYIAGRVSFIELFKNYTASLNDINCNAYQRYSLGLGYRLTGNTLLKFSYDWNEESGTTTSIANNNLLSAVVAAQF